MRGRCAARGPFRICRVALKRAASAGARSAAPSIRGWRHDDWWCYVDRLSDATPGKRAGRLEERDGKLYAAPSTDTVQRTAV
jgi:hypothetical protein